MLERPLCVDMLQCVIVLSVSNAWLGNGYPGCNLSRTWFWLRVSVEASEIARDSHLIRFPQRLPCGRRF